MIAQVVKTEINNYMDIIRKYTIVLYLRIISSSISIILVRHMYFWVLYYDEVEPSWWYEQVTLVIIIRNVGILHYNGMHSTYTCFLGAFRLSY